MIALRETAKKRPAKAGLFFGSQILLDPVPISRVRSGGVARHEGAVVLFLDDAEQELQLGHAADDGHHHPEFEDRRLVEVLTQAREQLG